MEGFSEAPSQNILPQVESSTEHSPSTSASWTRLTQVLARISRKLGSVSSEEFVAVGVNNCTISTTVHTTYIITTFQTAYFSTTVNTTYSSATINTTYISTIVNTAYISHNRLHNIHQYNSSHSIHKYNSSHNIHNFNSSNNAYYNNSPNNTQFKHLICVCSHAHWQKQWQQQIITFCQNSITWHR